MGSLTVQTFFAVIPPSPPSTTCWKGLAAEALAEALAEVAVAEALAEALAEVPFMLQAAAAMVRRLDTPMTRLRRRRGGRRSTQESSAITLP